MLLWRPCFFGRGLFRGQGKFLSMSTVVGWSGPCPRWWGGCGGWWLVAEGEAGASGAAFPRWSVGTIPLRFSSCSLAAGWEAGPAGRAVRGRMGFRGSKQPFGAEPVGGVRNREKGASCLSAASSCPAGSAARRPGSSQRQGCPFFWFFSLGRQRKERHPAGGRWHSGGAGAPWSPFPRWSVGTSKKRDSAV